MMPIPKRRLASALLLHLVLPASGAHAGGVTVTRDIAYGAAALERLDVYAKPGLHAAPVVIFVHGGAYRFGDKEGSGSSSENVALFLARNGMVAVSANYRLAPSSVWPAAIEDVAGMVAWAHRNAARFGGDTRRIVLIGHSAGATHVAGYIFDRRFQPKGGPDIAGAVLVSGRYMLESDPRDPNRGNMETYFGTDRTKWTDRAPLTHVWTAPHLDVMLVAATHDNEGLLASWTALLAALCARDGRCPASLQLANETHYSEMRGIGTDDTALSAPLLAFIAAATGTKAR